MYVNTFMTVLIISEYDMAIHCTFISDDNRQQFPQ